MFYIGDRIQTTVQMAGGCIPIGSTGTVMFSEDDGGDIGIAYDHFFQGGHDLGGLCVSGHGWWTPQSWVVPCSDPVECSASDLSALFD